MKHRQRRPGLRGVLPLASLLVMWLGCGAAPSRPATPDPAASDKAALYGDAALIPTRAGEQARAEVALAEEIRVALETLHAVEEARVTVSLDAEHEPRAAAVVVRGRATEDPNIVSQTAERLTHAVLAAPEVDVEVVVSIPASADITPNESPWPRRGPLLVLAVLGFGFSLGLTADRARRRLRRRR